MKRKQYATWLLVLLLVFSEKLVNRLGYFSFARKNLVTASHICKYQFKLPTNSYNLDGETSILRQVNQEGVFGIVALGKNDAYSKPKIQRAGSMKVVKGRDSRTKDVGLTFARYFILSSRKCTAKKRS